MTTAVSKQAVIITVRGCQNLMNRSANPEVSQQTDPTVIVFDDTPIKKQSLSNTPILQTPMAINNCNPTFDTESASVSVVVQPGTLITFQVWHGNFNNYVAQLGAPQPKTSRQVVPDAAFLGETTLSGERLLSLARGKAIEELGARVKETDPAVKALASTPGSLGTIMIEWGPDDSATQVDKAASAESTTVLGQCAVVGGKNLLKRDGGANQLSDPYVVVSYPTRLRRLWRSRPCDCTLNPVFADSHPIEVRGLLPSCDLKSAAPLPPSAAGLTDKEGLLCFHVWNQNPLPERDNFLGTVAVRPSSLVEGLNLLHLEPREDEQDSVIAKLGKRLGWLEVLWTPAPGPMTAAAKAVAEQRLAPRKGNRSSAGGATVDAVGDEFGAEAAAAADANDGEPRDEVIETNWRLTTQRATVVTVIDDGPPPLGTSVFMPSPSKLPRQERTVFSPHHPHVEMPTPFELTSGAACLTLNGVPRGSGSAAAAQLATLSATSSSAAPPPQPSTTYGPPLAASMQSTVTVAPPPPVAYNDPPQQPFSSSTAAQPPFPSTYPPIMGGGNQHTCNSSVVPAGTKVIEMTEMVPVRVSRGLDARDYMLHVDEPIRSLQSQFETHFCIQSNLQVLTYLGERVDTDHSLRHNGCLLLKGSPYVHFMLSVAKGPMLNLVFVLPNRREIMLAIPEGHTISKIKKQLCNEHHHSEDSLQDPHNIRLLWRYNELNDKSTLQYYNIPTNAKITVAKKPVFHFNKEHEQADGQSYTQQRSGEAVYDDYEYENAPPRPLGVKPSSRPGSTHRERPAARTTPPPASSTTSAPASRRPASALKKVVNQAMTQPQPANNTGDARYRPASHAASVPQQGGAAAGGLYSVSQPRPKPYYELTGDGTAIDDPEIRRLRSTVRNLEEQVQQQMAHSNHSQQQIYEAKVSQLQRDLEESDRRCELANERIDELEKTVERLQTLLRRATQAGY